MSNVSVGTSATRIVQSNERRQSLLIENNSNLTLYIGEDSSVTTSNGIAILPDGILTESNDGTKLYMGDYWGIVETSTADIRYWERTRC